MLGHGNICIRDAYGLVLELVELGCKKYRVNDCFPKYRGIWLLVL